MTLYVSDLDGTLLNQQGQLSLRSRQALVRMLEQGLLFTVASARHVSSIRHVLGDLPLRLPVISGNGACLSDMHSGRHELVRTMDAGVAQSVYALIRQHQLLPFFSTHGSQSGDRLYYQSAQNAGQQSFIDERLRTRDPRLKQTDRLQDHLTESVVTFVVVAEMAALEALQQAVQGLCGEVLQTHLQDDMYAPHWPWLTIHDRLATKDQAILTLVDRYALGEREIVVFGDHVNDVTMLRAAHRGIAMGNAIDAVKREAHTVIGAHHEDSVVDFIERDWRG